MNGPRYTFRGRTLSEAYARMKEKLGNHFEVEETRTVREGGWLGWFGRTTYEVVARPLPKPRTSHSSLVSQAPASPTGTVSPERLKYLEEVVREAQQRMMGQQPSNTIPSSTAVPVRDTTATDSKNVSQAKPSRAAVPSPEAGHLFTARIGDQIETENRLTASVAENKKKNSPASSATLSREKAGPFVESAIAPALVPFPERDLQDNPDLHRELRELREMVQALWLEHPASDVPPGAVRWYQALVRAGMTRRTAAALIRMATERVDNRVVQDPRVFAERLRMVSRKLIRITGGIRPMPGKRHVAALCGTTGVGKTTTVAKLAARFALQEHLRVALLTLDTYRIAATEQLRVYADIIGVPLKVAAAPDEAAAILDEFGDRDLVLVDTAGSSQFNLEQLRDLQALLTAVRPDETILVMAANTPVEDLRVVAARFSVLSPASIIFTKLDETRRYGGMLDFLLERGIPLAYCCTGQNVPDDIELATPGLIAGLMTEGSTNRE